MGKLVVSLDGVVIKEVQITKDKTTLGRRPYNDIVIDNLAVSGEHAVLQMVGRRRLHRRPEQHQRHLHQRQGVKKQLLTHNDTVEIGKYKIKFLVEDGTDYEKTMIMKPGALSGGAGDTSTCAAAGRGGVDRAASAACGMPARRRSRCSTAPRPAAKWR